MSLTDLPQFTVDDVRSREEEGNTIVVGRLSHLRGVRLVRGYLYRVPGPSILGDLDRIPSTSAESVQFVTLDGAFAPDLKPGASFPWLDSSWEPHHLAMVLSPIEQMVEALVLARTRALLSARRCHRLASSRSSAASGCDRFGHARRRLE